MHLQDVVRRTFHWGLTAALLLSAVPPAGAVDARDVIGVAHAAGRYNFTSGDFLNEGADRILELGSRVIKVFLVPGHVQDTYPFNSDWSPTPADIVETVQKPYVQELFAKPFSTFILVIVPVTGTPQFLDGLSADEAAAENDQMYRLAKYLLTTYANTGKTFILQNWEGDHLLRQGLTASDAPDAVRVQGMIDWWNARQAGVLKARQEVGTHGVDVLHAAEVNSVQAAMDGLVTATNNVIPYTHCDLYSYSSWDVGYTPEQLTRALDYLKSKAPDSRRFGRYNIYLGEYGLAKGQDGIPEGQRFERIRQLMEAALGWGVRYSVYWQVYCNEAANTYTGRPGNNDLRGFWLVRPDGVKAPMWNILAEQLQAGFYRLSLSSFSNQYFAVNTGDHSVSAARWMRDDDWELFTLKDWNGGSIESGDLVSLQAHDGLYLSVQPHSGGLIYARSSSSGTPERFVIHKVGGTGPIVPGDSISLETHFGRYLGSEVGGRGAIRALRYVPGPAEVFRYVAAAP
jgi:hypothetical protein